MSARPQKLMARVLVDVAALTNKWIKQAEAWNSHTHCEGCEFKTFHQQRVGAYDGSGVENFSVCEVGKYGTTVDQCPALACDVETDSGEWEA